MTKNYFFIFILFFIFTGCTSKNFAKSADSPNAIKYTKKRDIVKNDEIKAMFFASYLNRVSDKFESSKLDSFIVGIHYVNRNNHDLIENRFKLTLNEEEPLNMIKLNKDSDLLKNISLKNQWASYYLVHFKKAEFEDVNEVKKLNLKLSHPVLGSVLIDFRR